MKRQTKLLAILLTVQSPVTSAQAQPAPPSEGSAAAEESDETKPTSPVQDAQPSDAAPAERGAGESAKELAGEDTPEAGAKPEGTEGSDSKPIVPLESQRESGDPAQTAAQSQPSESSETTTAPEDDPSDASSSPEPEDDPYEGLDHTGTPPPPKKESDDPEGEWDESYDGRRKEKRAEDALIWIPRAPLLPAHLVLNYGVRWPIVKAVAKAEEVRLFHRIEDFFTFDDGKGGYYPQAFWDKGRGFWAGAHFFYNDWGQEGHSVRATAGAGTNGWIIATATDSWTVFDHQRGTLGFNVLYVRDPALAFAGFGPETDIDDQVFFTQERLGGEASLDVHFAELNRFHSALEYRHARLTDTGRDPEFSNSDFASLTDEFTSFDDWFDLATFDMRLELDTRTEAREFSSGSGLRWESWGNYNFGWADDVLSFFRYGTKPTVFVDFTGHNHVLALSAAAEALSKTDGDDPPLSETVSLGGGDRMKGFYPGRFRGESSLVYQAAYSWPVLAFADALLFTEMGTAYNGFFDDFSHDAMALSWGTGARTSLSRSFGIEFLLAWGTNRAELWDESFEVDNTRFLVGFGSGVGK